MGVHYGKISKVFVVLLTISQINSFRLKESMNGDDDYAASWENLENKLNSIENNEKKLLESLLHGERTRKEVKEESFSGASEGLKVELNANVNEVTERIPRDSSEQEGAERAIQKLVENSKRMESMVIMLADLKNVLSQAVIVQESQMALRTEVIELRDEIEYLRQEIRKMKSEQAAAEGSVEGSPKLENRIHNDETTLEWLKESVKELRHEMVEVSSSINVTGLLHMKQVWDKEGQRVNKDFQTIQKKIEGLAVGQAQNSEAILEVKGDIADLRTWQAKMGQKFIQDQTRLVTTTTSATMNHSEIESGSGGDLTRKQSLELLALAQLENSETDVESEHPSRHSGGKRKLRKEMKTMERMIMGVVHEQSFLHKRLSKLEMKENLNKMSQVGKTQNTRKDFPSEEDENEILSQDETLEKVKNLRQHKSVENYSASTLFRLSSLERSIADYSNTLESVDSKVSALNELKNSNTQLFTALEGLEAKYDERLGDIHSNMAKIEASVSSESVTTAECMEQQKYQSGVMQSIRKDVDRIKERAQSNSMRVAYVQSQMVTWGIKTCVDESSESIQNIKIAALEAKLSSESSST